MTGINRWSMMIYSTCRLNLRGPSLTVVSIGMGHLSLVILLLMYLNRLTKRSKYFGGCIYSSIRCAECSYCIENRIFCNLCCKPSKIKFCIEEVSVGEIYNTLLDSNKGDLSPHTSQTIYFSKTNENKISDKEASVGEVVELESGIEPLWIILINIRGHSVLSLWFCLL